MTSAGDVATHGVDGSDQLTGGETFRWREAPGLWKLAFGKGADISCCHLERLLERGVELSPGSGHLFLRDAKLGGILSGVCEAVELLCVVEQRFVALLSNVVAGFFGLWAGLFRAKSRRAVRER